MARNKSHGVVIVYVGPSTQESRIHRPETHGNHGASAMASGNWELFPSLAMATEAGYPPCPTCFRAGG